jgi:hypothetical protein
MRIRILNIPNLNHNEQVEPDPRQSKDLRPFRGLQWSPWRLTLEPWGLTMEPLRLTVEPRRLAVEPRRLTMEPWRISWPVNCRFASL